jgi:type III secretion protein L
MSSPKIVKRATGNGSLSSGPITKRQIVEAREEARRLLAAAANDAATIRQNAETAAQTIREDAKREGNEAALLEWNTLLFETRERRDQALASAERDILRLAVKIAEKIIGREIERDRTAVVDIVANAMRQARRNETVTVRVNPADLELIETHRHRLARSTREQLLDIVPDPRVRSAGCLIESESGAIDARLETQLRVLERALLTKTADSK